MPLEIRELVIRATVGDPGDDKSSPAPGDENPSVNGVNINLLVEKVLEILKERSER